MVMIAITDAKDMGRIFRYAAELGDGLGSPPSVK